MKKRRVRRDGAFTLIELLLVIAIIAILAMLVVPNLAGRTEEARKATARSQVRTLFGTALDVYEADNGHYPSTAQGLKALREKPSGDPQPRNWKGPYLKTDVPQDPWGNEYVYRQPGTSNPNGYDLLSPGPDAREGGEDDITSW